MRNLRLLMRWIDSARAFATFHVDALAQHGGLLEIKIAIEGDLIFLFHLKARMGQVERELPVIREQNQSFAFLV